MPLQAAKYRFGPYEVQIRTRELYKQGIRLKLRPQAFQVLNLLLERAGDVVTREELRRKLWPEGTFVGFEQGLNTSIKELRRALNDSPGEPRYIETLPKVGYRLIAAVEREEPASEISALGVHSAAAAIREPELPIAILTEPPPKPGRQRTWILYGVIALLLVTLAGYWRWRRVSVPAHAADARLMFAVLPFENLTGDPAQEYLSDGLTEEMTAQFGRLDPQHLGVIARTSVMSYKHTQKRLAEIARELGVQYLLEGSVRTDSKNIRVSVQLIRAEDQAQAWEKSTIARLPICWPCKMRSPSKLPARLLAPSEVVGPTLPPRAPPCRSSKLKPMILTSRACISGTSGRWMAFGRPSSPTSRRLRETPIMLRLTPAWRTVMPWSAATAESPGPNIWSRPKRLRRGP